MSNRQTLMTTVALTAALTFSCVSCAGSDSGNGSTDANVDTTPGVDTTTPESDTTTPESDTTTPESDTTTPDTATPNQCSDLPDIAPPELQLAVAGTAEFYYAAVPNPKALLIFFHGSGGSKNIIMTRIQAAAIARRAMDEGIAIASLDSDAHVNPLPNETKPKWNTDDTAENPDVKNVNTMVEMLRSPVQQGVVGLGVIGQDTPVVAFGASNGGTFVSRLAQHLEMPVAVVYISNAQRFQQKYRNAVQEVIIPPLFLAAGENDGTVNYEDMEFLYDAAVADGIEAEFHLNVRAPFTASLLTQIPGLDCAQAEQLFADLVTAKIVNEEGDVAGELSKNKIKTAIPANAQTYLKQIYDLLNEAYAGHAVANDFDDALFSFIEAHL